MTSMTIEEAKKILNSLIPKPIRGDGKSTTHLQITEALLMGMDALDKTKWIPVSDPPKEDGKYLAYIVNKDDPKFRYSMTCQFIQNRHVIRSDVGFYMDDNPWFPDDECASNNVVAWMPLPEDYKEGED